jgi:hypothetical protein
VHKAVLDAQDDARQALHISPHYEGVRSARVFNWSKPSDAASVIEQQIHHLCETCEGDGRLTWVRAGKGFPTA